MDRTVASNDADQGLELTVKDRLMLSNQYLILEKLYPEEADTFAKRRKIVESGFTFEYAELATNVDSHEMPEAASKRVREILDMYEMMHRANQDLEDTGIPTNDIRFPGFDGNSEAEELSYARFLLNDPGLWEQLERPKDLNSHFPTRSMYDRMLQEWDACTDKYQLTRTELQQIINAAKQRAA